MTPEQQLREFLEDNTELLYNKGVKNASNSIDIIIAKLEEINKTSKKEEKKGFFSSWIN